MKFSIDEKEDKNHNWKAQKHYKRKYQRKAFNQRKKLLMFNMNEARIKWNEKKKWERNDHWCM